MPEIIVRAESGRDERAPILLRERVTADNMEIGHYADQLIERIGWAVVDATEAQEATDEPPADA